MCSSHLCSAPACLLASILPAKCTEAQPVMAPHLTADELDRIAILRSSGFSASEVHARIKAARDRRHFKSPTLNNIRLAMQGKTYSPDLNPLDFTLWRTIEKSTKERIGKKRMSVKSFKTILKSTALSLPRAAVQESLHGMVRRIADVYHAGGGDISRD